MTYPDRSYKLYTGGWIQDLESAKTGSNRKQGCISRYFCDVISASRPFLGVKPLLWLPGETESASETLIVMTLFLYTLSYSRAHLHSIVSHTWAHFWTIWDSHTSQYSIQCDRQGLNKSVFCKEIFVTGTFCMHMALINTVNTNNHLALYYVLLHYSETLLQTVCWLIIDQNHRLMLYANSVSE